MIDRKVTTVIDAEKCIGCELCVKVSGWNVWRPDGQEKSGDAVFQNQNWHVNIILTQTRPPRLARTRLPREAQAGMVAGVGRKGAKISSYWNDGKMEYWKDGFRIAGKARSVIPLIQ